MASKSILVVDDNALQLAIVGDMLRRLGYQPVTFQSALEALRGDLSQYALVLSDVNMPGMDGHSFVESVRARHCHAPFVFITGEAGPKELLPEEVRYRAEYLMKPVLAEELEAIVARLVGAPA